MRVVAVLAAENQRAGKLGMPQFAIRPFAAGHYDDSRRFQISNQLANLTRHTVDFVTKRRSMPTPNLLTEETNDRNKRFQRVKRATRTIGAKLAWLSIPKGERE